MISSPSDPRAPPRVRHNDPKFQSLTRACQLERITAVDGPDAFRIKIWELSSGDVLYDNKMGEDEGSPSATALGGGSIVIHR